MSFLYILSFLLVATSPIHSADDWSYDIASGDGPHAWFKTYAKCSGNSQSPINIQTDSVLHDVNLPKPVMNDKWAEPITTINYTLENSGHSVKVMLRQNGDYFKTPIFTTIGTTKWRLIQFHWHWSGDNKTGSEHTKDGKSYPAELHMIHANEKYNTVADAVANSDGLMVFGFFVELVTDSMHVNSAITKFFNALSNVTYRGDSQMMERFALKDMLFKSNMDMDLGHFYTYNGSLTTPGCEESVKWMVFDKMIYITPEQMNVLRTLQSHNKTYTMANGVDNPTVGRYRPVQSLNGRVVRYSKARQWQYTSCKSVSPDKWRTYYDQCAGTKQSPINIVTQKAIHKDRVDVVLGDYWMKPVNTLNYTLNNDGHSVRVMLQENGDYFKSPIMTTVGADKWRLIQFHFHWSGNDYEGSEHTMNGESYPGELHLIHSNPKYTTLGGATTNSDGLMVFGFFMKITDDASKENKVITNMFNNFTNIKYEGKSQFLEPFGIAEMLKMGSTLGNYYKYQGSLTTPGCNEVVTWMVFEDPLYFTKDQFMKLRALQHHDENYYITHSHDSPVVPRYRPVQRLHGRTVEYYRDAANQLHSTLFIFVALLALFNLY